MRVLMVIERLIAGGAETAALELTGGLVERGWEVTIVAVRAGGSLGEAFVRAGAEVHDGVAGSRFDLTSVVRIARIIRSRRIESVIIVDALRNGTLFAALGAVLSRRKVRTICWCHSVPDGQAGRFTRWLHWYVRAGLLETIVCVSDFQRHRLLSEGLPDRSLVVIPNGVDLTRFTWHSRPGHELWHGRPARECPVPEIMAETAMPQPMAETAMLRTTDLPLPVDKQIVVQVANVVPDKDFQTLIAAATDLAKTRDDFHLVLVGEGTDSGEMVRAIEQVGLSGLVTQAGRRDDVPVILAAADVLVHSTKSETFGLAVLEALAAGVPVVVSDVPAFDELFTDEVEGLKVRPGDADALSGAIARLLGDRDLRRRMGAAGRKRAEDFSAARMADEFHQLLTVRLLSDDGLGAMPGAVPSREAKRSG